MRQAEKGPEKKNDYRRESAKMNKINFQFNLNGGGAFK